MRLRAGQEVATGATWNTDCDPDLFPPSGDQDRCSHRPRWRPSPTRCASTRAGLSVVLASRYLTYIFSSRGSFTTCIHDSLNNVECLYSLTTLSGNSAAQALYPPFRTRACELLIPFSSR